MTNKLTRKQQRELDMVKRIAELIKAANTTDEIILAAYLVKNGIVDKKVVNIIAYYFDD